MKKSKDIMDYYAGDNIPQGLEEAKYAIKQLLDYCGEKEISLYYKEIFNCIDKAVKILDK
tara:strand:+ start:1911 stop:2090 length:180 start_codon:yes stop_codon:yes gene_type:complete